jgi:D-tyrosyl-tRNA(Tyr) deacylase
MFTALIKFMRALIQRVNRASVSIDDEKKGSIDAGMLVFLGISKEDDESKIPALVDKIINLRIFPKEDKEFDASLLENKGACLVVSQFTLYGNCKKGRRPSFDEAAAPADAKNLYEIFIERLKGTGIQVETGEFQAYMNVALENDGPVTLLVEV